MPGHNGERRSVANPSKQRRRLADNEGARLDAIQALLRLAEYPDDHELAKEALYSLGVTFGEMSIAASGRSK